MKRVYFQKFGPVPFSDFVYNAYDGFQHDRDANQYTLKFYESISEVPVGRDIMVIGCIEDTIEYLTSLGVEIPPAMNVPTPLIPLINRRLKVMSLEEFFETPLAPIFVKPVNLKQCQSGFIKSDSSKRLVLSDAPAGIDVLTSTPMDIVNEYRAFVNRGKFVGLRQYNVVEQYDHLFHFPDPEYMLKCLIAMNNSGTAPVSYTMDFAVLRDGSTEVIECNDGWSVSTYGLDSVIFKQFLVDRWKELTMKQTVLI